MVFSWERPHNDCCDEWCAGGEDRTASFSTVERFAPKTNTWTEAPSMKGKRAGAGVTVCDGKIYVAGESGHDDNSDDKMRYKHTVFSIFF